MNKIRKCNETLDLENMVHMLIFLKHLNSWSCFVLLFLISLRWLIHYKGSLQRNIMYILD